MRTEPQNCLGGSAGGLLRRQLLVEVCARLLQMGALGAVHRLEHVEEGQPDAR
jgi:hypothetical protein